MHSAINTTRESAYAQMQEKEDFYIRYLVINQKKARDKLKKMDSKIKRSKDGKVAKNSEDDFERMEVFRKKLNEERIRVKSGLNRQDNQT